MDDATRFALNTINRRFYRDFSRAFSDTRSQPWPGWSRVIARPPLEPSPGVSESAPLHILDVGCGNGRFGRFLSRRLSVPFEYFGIDASPELLEMAQVDLERCGIRDLQLQRADLLEVGLDDEIGDRRFDLIVVFGVLHHIAGHVVRERLVRDLSRRLDREGVLALSFWQFGAETRFQKRILSWSRVEGVGVSKIDTDQLEEGDYLLTWGPCGEPRKSLEQMRFRFCHHSSDAEIDRLVAGLDLLIEDSFRSDGAERVLNRYEILRRRD